MCGKLEAEVFMPSLADKTCVPCKGGVPPIKGEELRKLMQQLPQWKVIDEHHVIRAYTFPDFEKALDFVNRVGDVAEEQGHHPDILLGWGKAQEKCLGASNKKKYSQSVN